jgi:hypothetical protein
LFKIHKSSLKASHRRANDNSTKKSEVDNNLINYNIENDARIMYDHFFIFSEKLKEKGTTIGIKYSDIITRKEENNLAIDIKRKASSKDDIRKSLLCGKENNKKTIIEFSSDEDDDKLFFD